MTSGELFIVVFIVFAVVSAPYWPKLGGAIAVAIVGKNGPTEPPPHDPGPGEKKS